MKVIKGQRAEQWKIGQKVDSKWELIQQLIPLGLKAVEEELQQGSDRDGGRILQLQGTQPSKMGIE